MRFEPPRDVTTRLANSKCFAMCFVIMFTDTPAERVEVRIVGGESEHEGRVEVKYMGEWALIPQLVKRQPPYSHHLVRIPGNLIASVGNC